MTTYANGFINSVFVASEDVSIVINRLEIDFKKKKTHVICLDRLRIIERDLFSESRMKLAFNEREAGGEHAAHGIN